MLSTTCKTRKLSLIEFHGKVSKLKEKVEIIRI